MPTEQELLSQMPLPESSYLNDSVFETGIMNNSINTDSYYEHESIGNKIYILF